MNLLKETLEDIARSGHAPHDIVFIGSEASGHRCMWPEFLVLADFDYDSGFGGQEIATDLIIVFSDGTKMWRHEYDGSEHWKYSRPFTMPTTLHPIMRLKGAQGEMWASLADMNDDAGQ